MAQKYYANKYGIQLEEFLIWASEWDLKFWKYNFTTGQGFALTCALKYVVRAGKKPNEPYEKDMGKYNDYINMAVKMGFERSEAEDWVALQKSIFEEFKGRKAELEEERKRNVFKYCALNRQKFLWFKTFEDMAKHFGVTESYLKLWLNKNKPLNGWFVKEVNYDSELERLQ